MLDFIGLIWNQLILGPMVNSLVFLYVILFDNFGLSIVVFTVIIRLITVPLTLKQIRMTRGMSQIQPLVKELQKKYADDKAKLSRETMALYKAHGVNPIGCLGPMVIQMPIWIGLYQGIIQTLPAQPERLIGLSQKLYAWLPFVNQAVPLDSSFLWIDLAISPGDQNDFLLPAIVGLSMWAVQKMSLVPSTDARQAQTNKMMLWMMPLMMTFFSFQLPTGLALYWVVSNLIQMFIQYFITGWGNLIPSRNPAPTPQAPTTQPDKEIEQDGKSGSDGTNSGGSNRDRPGTAKRRARSGRNRRH